MLQHGQVFKLRGGTEEKSLWAYRFRVGGRGSSRVQRGGFASERDASEALERALERVRRERGCGTALTLAELVDEYLAQHDGHREAAVRLVGRACGGRGQARPSPWADRDVRGRDRAAAGGMDRARAA